MKTFYFVTECGRSNRTIFQIGDEVHIGCFRGDYIQAKNAIKGDYKGEERAEYLRKLELLKQGGETWDKYPWYYYSAYVARYSPENLDPARFDWDNESGTVAAHCPDKIDGKRFNWEIYTRLVLLHCPDKISLMEPIIDRHIAQLAMYAQDKGYVTSMACALDIANCVAAIVMPTHTRMREAARRIVSLSYGVIRKRDGSWRYKSPQQSRIANSDVVMLEMIDNKAAALVGYDNLNDLVKQFKMIRKQKPINA